MLRYSNHCSPVQSTDREVEGVGRQRQGQRRRQRRRDRDGNNDRDKEKVVGTRFCKAAKDTGAKRLSLIQREVAEIIFLDG